MEEEQLQPTPELTPEPVPDEIPGQSGQTPKETNNNMEPANPVNTGLPEPPPDPGNEFNYENVEEIPPQDDAAASEIMPGADDQEQTGKENADEKTDTEEAEDGEETGTVTNVTIVRPPVQITYQADETATYHGLIENTVDDPVPVVVMETLVEPEPGIMEKRLEDYSVTEGLLLCILAVLILRMVFDYGRRVL